MLKSIVIAAAIAAVSAAAAPASAGLKWNGPGLVLQSKLFNGLNLNGPGIVIQGSAPNGTHMLNTTAVPAPERIDLTLAVHSVTLASGETIAVD